MSMNATTVGAAAIVLAESDAETRAAIHAELEPAGHIVLDAGDGREVIDLTRRQPPDLILLAADLPNWGSWEVLEELAANIGTADIPIVLIASEDDARIGLRMGAFDHVPRPINTVELLSRVSAAIRAKRLIDTLEEERRRSSLTSGIDALTGMLTHQRVTELLEHFSQVAQRYQEVLSVVRLDIDHFTRINDEYGSPAGDSVLREVGERLQADLRRSDVAGRWGDDEFIVVLPHTDVRGSVVFAQRFRLTVAEMPTFLPDGASVGVSASFGCADGTDAEDLLRTSGELVREAKRRGRNTVCHRHSI